MDSFHCSVFYFTDFLKFMMPSLNRKLLLFPVKHNGDDDSTCPGSCHEIPFVLLPPTPHLHPNHSITITMSVVAFAIASCLLFGFLVAVIRRYCFRQNVRGSGTPVLFLMCVDSLREDDHRVVDHPIWLINTVGLDRSVIDSIAICEFKKGDGLIDGTECAICLGEFEEGENLRLLPKCNHAFHVSCIDTWLGSHKNCPLCRAPIVRDVPLPCGEIILEESRSNMETLEPSSVMVSGNVDDCERKSEGESGSRGENEVRKQPKRAPSSIGSSSFTETRRTTAVNKLSRFAKDANNMPDAVCTKDSESSWNKIRRSSSDAGILSFKKTSRQTPIHLF